MRCTLAPALIAMALVGVADAREEAGASRSQPRPGHRRDLTMSSTVATSPTRDLKVDAWSARSAAPAAGPRQPDSSGWKAALAGPAGLRDGHVHANIEDRLIDGVL